MADKIQILLDANAIGYCEHHKETILTGDGLQVQAVLGVLRTIREIRTEFPLANIIALWDGVSWRKDVLASYKENREADFDSFDTSAPMDPITQRRFESAVKKAASRKAYKDQTPFIQRALRSLGIPQATCYNYEADDLAALFCDRYHAKGLPVRLVTSDGDWLQLIRDRVVWKSHMAPFTFVSLKNFAERTGYASPKLFVESKMLAGDKGDCVDGVGGFGAVTVANFFKVFPGGLDEFFSLSADFIENAWRSNVGKKAPAAVLDLFTAGPENPALKLNRTLVDLRTPDRPAPSEIKIDKGAFDPDDLLDLTKRLDLYRLSSDLGRFLSPFKEVA